MIMEIMHKGQTYQVFYDDALHGLISRYNWHLAKGYARTTFPNKNGKRLSISMHRLVLNHTAKHTHHINGNTLDNRFLNLEGLSVREHAKRGKSTKSRSTRFKPGEECPSVKLTNDKVLEMREWHRAGVSIPQLSRIFGVGRATVWEAINKITWKHI